MKIKTRANKAQFNLHCPGCGKTEFIFILQFRDGFNEWRRCKKCGLDVLIKDDTQGLILHAVMEETGHDERKEEMKYE